MVLNSLFGVCTTLAKFGSQCEVIVWNKKSQVIYLFMCTYLIFKFKSPLINCKTMKYHIKSKFCWCGAQPEL